MDAPAKVHWIGLACDLTASAGCPWLKRACCLLLTATLTAATQAHTTTPEQLLTCSTLYYSRPREIRKHSDLTTPWP